MSAEIMAFFCCCRYQNPNIHLDYIMDKFLSYNPKQYIIAKAWDDKHQRYGGQRLYFIVEWRMKQDYHNFSNLVFIKHLELIGRSKEDQPREYGRMKTIQDLDEMKAYFANDKTPIKNVPSTEIERLIQSSYPKKKVSSEDFQQLLFEELDKLGSVIEDVIGIFIHKYMADKGKYPLERTVDRHKWTYMLTKKIITQEQHYHLLRKR
jgi:hypothetical protein